MKRTKNNAQIYGALVAVAKAHMHMEGFDVTKAKDIAVKIDAACREDRQMEVMFALVACLLRGVGVPDVNDLSRFH